MISYSAVLQALYVCADVRGGWEDVQVGYLLGRGSSGSVYRATCNGQHVAVKVSTHAQCFFLTATHHALFYSCMQNFGPVTYAEL